MALAMPAGRVVVVGSGMAELFSTRVLSDSFDEVVLIDRDNTPRCRAPAACWSLTPLAREPGRTVNSPWRCAEPRHD